MFKYILKLYDGHSKYEKVGYDSFERAYLHGQTTNCPHWKIIRSSDNVTIIDHVGFKQMPKEVAFMKYAFERKYSQI